MSWSIEDAASVYGINHWGDGYFGINAQGHVAVKPRADSEQAIDVYDLVAQVNQRGQDLPMLFRFPDILQDRVKRLCGAFDKAIDKYDYDAQYTAIYPIKVNQQESVVKNIIATHEQGVSIGLEAGSKPELMIVLAFAPRGGTIVCNGYKDREFIRMALIGQKLGHNVFIVIEKESEVDLIIEEAKHMGMCANLGLRVRLSSLASSKWADTGGDKGKFGLSASQLISAQKKLQAAGLADYVRLMHFHMGSQIANIADYRLGFREALRYFAELRALGLPIETIDVGGGLGVDYEGTRSQSDCSVNYGLNEYANNIIWAIGDACEENGLPHPTVITESGRAVTAHHTVLVSNIIGVERNEYTEATPPAQDAARPLQSMWETWQEMHETGNRRSLREWLHDSQMDLHDIHIGYSSGTFNLQERAWAEQLYLNMCHEVQKQLDPSNRAHRPIIDELQERMADKIYVNFSLFQSMPDAWGIDQLFPVMPLEGLNMVPERRAVLLDITCDSDGAIDHYVDGDGIATTMPMPEYDPENPPMLGFFMVGAYQEILGNMHNLFGDTEAVDVFVFPDGSVEVELSDEGDTVADMLQYVQLDPNTLLTQFRDQVKNSGLDEALQQQFLEEFEAGLYGYTYLEDE